MNDIVSIQLEWVYTPEDYFHQPLSIPCEGGNIVINNGSVMAEIDPHVGKGSRSIAEKLDDQVETLFHDERIKSQKPYELGMPFKVVIKKDGSRIVSPAWVEIFFHRG